MDKKIIGFDLGSNLGHCFLINGVPTHVDTIKLKHNKDTREGQRFQRADELISSWIRYQSPDLVTYERVHRFMSAQAALIYNGLLGILMMNCENYNVPYIGYSPTEIKKFATGNGKASKEDMIWNAQSSSGMKITDDNAADAYWVAKLAHSKLSCPS